MSRTVGITIPAYKPDISRLNRYIKSIQELDFVDTIHIELDNASTVDICSIVGFDSMNTVEERRGKGKAITAGFDSLSTDVLAFADADGATPANSLKKVIFPVQSESVPMAVGSRRHPDADIISHQTVIRRRLGDVFALTARQLSSASLYDYQCGAKALSADVWDTIRPHVHESGFAFDFELIELASRSRHEIREVPVVWDDVSESTVNPIKDSIIMAMKLYTIQRRSTDITEIDSNTGDTISEKHN